MIAQSYVSQIFLFNLYICGKNASKKCLQLNYKVPSLILPHSEHRLFFQSQHCIFDTYKNNCFVRLTYIFAKDGKRKCWIYCEYANITGFTEDLLEEDAGHTTPLYNGSRIIQVHQPVLYLTTNGIHMLCVYTLLASKRYEPAIILTALRVLSFI